MSDIQKAINGDKKAFERVILQNKSIMYKTAIVILRNEDDAYDAIQEALIKIYNGINNLHSEEAFKLWSRRILLNCCYDIINKNNKVTKINEKMTEIFEEYREDSYECDDEIVVILDKIEPDLRTTTILYYYDNLSISEISQLLNIPIGTVKSRLSRTREKLYKLLEAERDDV